MSAPRRFEKTYEDIRRSKLTGGIERTEAVSTQNPIPRYHETYQFTSALLLSGATGVPLFLVQLFNFSDADDKFTSTPDAVLHDDDASIVKWQQLHEEDAPTPLTWVGQPITKDNDGSYKTAKGANHMYRLRLRNLWLDGGALCDVISQHADMTEDDKLIAMNKVNILGAYSSMSFDFKHNQADEYIEFAIAPQVAHGVKELWKGATWSVGKQMGITHTDRDARKNTFKRKVIRDTHDEKVDAEIEKQYEELAISTVVPDAAHALDKPSVCVHENTQTQYNAEVRTRTSQIPVDFEYGTVVRMYIR